MRTRWQQLPPLTWIAAAIGVLLVLILVIVLIARIGGSAPGSSTTGTSLRLDPGNVGAAARTTTAGGDTAAALALGDYSTCALVRGSTVQCWGDDAYDQLGTAIHQTSVTPVPANLPNRADAIAAGGSHACALLVNGRVACWGADEHGQAGTGSTNPSTAPALVHGIGPATAIAAGVAHTCAVLRSGQIWCWGANSNGQLGDGSTTDSSTPQLVGDISSARAVTAGLAHSCALLADGTVDCWGANANGQLGNAKTVDSPIPVAVTGLAGPAVAVDAGDAHTCALLRDGRVQCWGWNIEGQLGNGGGNDSASPVDVPLPGPARAISAGGSHTCALLRSGAVDCWGANLYGQLGNGTTSDSASPVKVNGLQNGVVAIATGLYHSCALLSGGSATCWGWNDQGQLGNGSSTSVSSPVGVAGLGLAPDGTGTVDAAPRAIPGSTRRTTITFRYTVASGGIHDGSFAVTVPPGWSLPDTRPSAPGYSTSTSGKVVTFGRTVSVTHLTLRAGAAITVSYGAGTGARPSKPGAAVWRVREQSSPTGNLSPLASSPVIHILSADGAGEVATTTTLVPNGAKNRQITFDYVAAPGGVVGGALELEVPPGWSKPAPGDLTASSGQVSVTGHTILVDRLKLAGDDHLKLVVRPAHAPSTAVGYQPWTFRLRAGPSGRLKALQSSPTIQVLAPNGSGNVYGFDNTIPNGSKNVKLTFTYGPASGGMKGGALAITVPPGWSAPSTSAADPGYVTSSQGKVTVSGRTVHVALGDVRSSLQITYGASKGAHAPDSNVGPQPWLFKQRSVPKAALKQLASTPSVTVLSADGSGTLKRATGSVSPGSTGNTVVFVYTAAPGGLDDGTLTLVVPDGWSSPSTSGGDHGYVTSTAGVVTIKDRTLTVSHVSLSSGQTLTIIYGSRAGGGPGASAPNQNLGPTIWKASAQSTPAGTLKPLK